MTFTLMGRATPSGAQSTPTLIGRTRRPGVVCRGLRPTSGLVSEDANGESGADAEVEQRLIDTEVRSSVRKLTRAAAATEATFAADRTTHRSASSWRDSPVIGLVAHCFHLSTSTPTTRSQRQSAPSPKSAGNWIQGTRSAANPGARMSVKL